VIVVCGEALIDLVIKDGWQTPSPGGGPFNAARALARLDVPTAFLGHLSNDEFGRLLADRLRTDGASLALATFGTEPTTTAIARIGPDGLAEYEFSIEGTSAPQLTLEMIPRTLAAEVDALHVGTLGLLLQPMATSLTELVRRAGRGRLIMLDPNIRPALRLNEGYRKRLEWFVSRSTVVKASVDDLAWLYPEVDYVAAARRMLDLGVRLILVTLGAQGASGTTAKGDVSVAAVPVDVVDTIGAGDAFGAAALAWLSDHELLDPSLALSIDELRSLLEFSCLAASLTCARAGAEPPTRAEIGTTGNRPVVPLD
jgi:fructokinase